MNQRQHTTLKRAAASIGVCAALCMLLSAAVPALESCSCPGEPVVVRSIACCSPGIVVQNCCSTSEATQPDRCCCSPESEECRCEGCSCGNVNNPASPLSPVPSGQQTFGLVLVGLVGDVAEFADAWSGVKNDRPGSGQSVNQSVTALEKCVILSRFHC